MKSAQLPQAQKKRLKKILKALRNGTTHGKFGGRILKRKKGYVSIPLGRRYRALFHRARAGYKFIDCFSHEDYNNIINQ